MAKYQKRIPFTEDQINILMLNPYTAKATPHKIRFTLEFKKYALKELEKPRMTYRKVFQNAGYDTELLGHERMKSMMLSIKKEAASPEGLREPKEGTREQELEKRCKAENTKRHTQTSIKDLQKRVTQLEQQIEFLKKLSHLNRKT